MGKPQFITTDAGEELVVMSRRDYDAMLARAGDEEAEDAMVERVLHETAGEVAIPRVVWTEIEAARSPVRPLRKWRGMTQQRLCRAAGISQGYLSQIEAGRRQPDLGTLRSLARALGVSLDAVASADE